MAALSHSVLVEGSILSGDQLRDYAYSHGVCPICAAQKTHRKAGSILNKIWEPITDTKNGEYAVYKGYCLQPTCYTLAEAQSQLGERTSPKKKKKRRSRKSLGSVSTSIHTTKPISRGIVVSKSNLSAVTRSTHNSSKSTLPRSQLILQPSPTLTTPKSTTSLNIVTRSSFARLNVLLPSAPGKEMNQKTISKTQWDQHLYRPILATSKAQKTNSIESQTSPSPATLQLHHLEDPHTLYDPSIILQVLEQHAGDPQVAACSLQSLRKTLVALQYTDFYSQNDSWINILCAKIKYHIHDVNVASQGVLSLLTVAAVSSKYAQSIISNKGIGLILAIDRSHEGCTHGCIGMSDRCCAALEVLLGACKRVSQGDLKCLVERLVFHALGRDIACSDYALRALFHVAQKTVRGRNELDCTIYQLVHSVDVVNLLWAKLDGDLVSALIAESALYLLWKLSVNKNSEGAQPLRVTRESAGSLLRLVVKYDDVFLHDAALCLVSCITLTAETAHRPEFVETVVSAVCHVLRRHPNQEIIQVKGLYVLTKTFGGRAFSAAIQEDIEISAIEAARQFPTSAALYAVACRIIGENFERGNAKENGRSNSVAPAFLAGAFQKCVFDFPHDEVDSIAAKDALISALIKVSGNVTACRELARSDLLCNVDRAMNKESDALYLASFHRIGINILTLLIKDVQHVQDSSDTKEGVSFSRHSCRLLEMVEISTIVAPECCILLAGIYSAVPFRGSFGQHSKLYTSLGSLAIVSHTQDEYNAILLSMRAYKENTEVQKVCCLALSNFIAPICHLKRAPESCDTIGHMTSGTLAMLADSVSFHKDNADVLCSCYSLFWTLIFVSSHADLQRWTPKLLASVFEASKRHKDSSEIKTVMVSVFRALLANDAGFSSLSSQQGVSALFDSLTNADDSIVIQAAETLACVVGHDFQTGSLLNTIKGVVSSILTCMTMHAWSVEVQLSLSSVLEALVARQESNICREVVHCGGLEAISTILRAHASEHSVIQYACQVLVGVLSEVDDNILWSHRLSLSQAIVIAFEAGSESPTAICLLEAILCLCDTADYFRELVAVCFPFVLRCMASNLRNVTLLKNGYRAIRVLTPHVDRRVSLIDRAGLNVVVNGLLVHPESKELLLEGLEAIKILALDSGMREALDRAQVQETIVCLMEINAQKPDILAQAFAALNNVVIIDAAKSQVSPLREGVIDMIILAMFRYPLDAKTQENSCMLLKSYTYSPNLFDLVSDKKDVLIPILVSAAENFPEVCGKRACSILKRSRGCNVPQKEFTNSKM